MMLLIIAFIAISLSFVLMAIDAADVFLAQRSLSSLADGAALAAAQGVDRSALYTGPPTCRLPLSPEGAEAAVSAYLSTASAPTDLRPIQVSVDAASETVTVTLGQLVQLPMQGLLGSIHARWASGVPISSSASAQAPISC